MSSWARFGLGGPGPARPHLLCNYDTVVEIEEKCSQGWSNSDIVRVLV